MEIYVLVLALLVGGEIDNGKMIKMDSRDDCLKHEAEWVARFHEHPDVLYHKCLAIPVPISQQLKKERDS